MQTSPKLGFLTILQEQSSALAANLGCYLGGYLTTNSWGRPLEFRLSTAVQPNRVQQILYGPTLRPYVYGELIGRTLIEKAGVPVDLVITDAEPALEARLHVAMPVVWLGGEDDLNAKQLEQAGAAAVGTASGLLLCHPKYPGDMPQIRKLLQALDSNLDWKEPFERIREALTEARKLGAADPRRVRTPMMSAFSLDALTGHMADSAGDHMLVPPVSESLAMLAEPELETLAAFARPLESKLRAARMLDEFVGARSLGKLGLEVSTESWRFPPGHPSFLLKPKLRSGPRLARPKRRNHTRLKASADVVMLKERLLYLLQPPLENLFDGREVHLPYQPYPYQLEGVAFLMPRWSALLADEMGLGKTMQAIVALRLLFHAGMIRRALLVCPKPLVPNWSRELRMWGEDVPFEVIGGDAEARRCGWLVSNCPLKLVNYELLTRDADYLERDDVAFDIVVLDEAQRIKNRESKTAQVVRGIKRERSWALTGTPIENRPDDLINLFAFIKPDHVPADTPIRRLPDLTGDCILRRVKEDVLTDLPPKTIRDAFVELTPAQRTAYELAEKDGIIRLNALGDTITVQHVFELIMRLKQICNFDPLTGQSAKLEQLEADLAEIADSGRKAIVFSQWVEPLEILAERLADLGPMQFHGRIPMKDRQDVLRRFKDDPNKHVMLMSYGTGSVGLNLQFANYVFLFDRWWNPAIEDQAINRAHRIGQQEPVFVTKFVALNTIEGRICEVLERKRQLFDELINQNGPPPSLGLSREDVFSLFDLPVKPRRLAA